MTDATVSPGAVAAGDRGPRKMSAVIRSSGLVIGARFAGVGLGLLTQVLLARLTSPSDLGLFFVAMSVAVVLSIVHTSGYPMIVPRIVVEAGRNRAPEELSLFMRHARLDLVAIACLTCAAALAAVWIWPGLGQTERLYVSAGVVAAPFMAFMRLNGSLANAQRRFCLGFVPDLVLRPLFMVGLLVAVWAVLPQFGLMALLIGHIPIVMALAFWQMLRVGPARDERDQPNGVGTAKIDNPWELRRQAGVMLIAVLFTGVIADLVLLISGMFLSSAELGIFGVCLKISMIAAFAVQAVHQIVVRDAAEAVRSGDREALKVVLGRTNGLGLAVALAGLIGAVLFGRQVLAVFGAAFVEGYSILIILMVAQVLRAMAGPATQMLPLVRSERACLPVFGGSIVMLIIGNVALAPHFGMQGAAMTFALVMGAWPFILSSIVKVKTGVNPAFGYR